MKNKTKIRAYIYPLTSRLITGVYNPYLDNFMDSTASFIKYINKNHPSSWGIFNLLRFITQIDALFLNWPENIPEKKGGIIQSFFLLILLRLKKMLKIRVVWTLHNKVSHSSDKLFFKTKLFYALLKRSDLIITHSKEGVIFAESIIPGSSAKLFYFPHPVVPKQNYSCNSKKYDILIWGTIAPYKGIDHFLAYFMDKGLHKKYRVLIVGKILPNDFYQIIKKYESPGIFIDNRYIANEELGELIALSHIVLFTYSSKSVLSSGALIDSISYKASVIGPNVGAFSELGNMGIIKTFDDFEELPDIIDKTIFAGSIADSEKLNNFIYSHTWEKFSLSLHNQMEKNGCF